MRKIIVIAAFGCFILSSVSDESATSHLLGSSSTPLMGSTAERIQNIQLAVKRIDGVVLKPGESFSFNEKVGERTLAAGYLAAPAIVHAKLQDVVGGGICQVSSTLFNAALLSDLQIVERHRHHTPINYLPLGMDATISWGTKDFRFKNTSKGCVQIVGRVTDKTVNFEMYSEYPIHDELRLETEITESPSLMPEDESEPGLEIALYRIRLKEGKIIAREFIHRDFYPARTIRK